MKNKKSPSSTDVVTHYAFPYVKFHGKMYPLIPLTIHHKKKQVRTFALIDSGASISVFTPEIAKALGISLKSKSAMHLGTADGGIDVSLVHVKLKVQKTQFRARVGFSNRQAATFNILGREGFFPKFSIAFNEIMKTVILVPLENMS